MTNHSPPLVTDFQHLVLLVGTNPLPPFVVACYFIEDQLQRGQLEHIWLIYSEIGPQQMSTLDHAQQLKQALELRFNLPIDLFPVHEIGSAPAIQRSMQPLADRLIGQSVHLNYSGGTKAMALHTYRVLEQRLGSMASFSYLDGRRFRIVSDGTGFALHTDELRHVVHIRLQELIALQGFTTYTPWKTRPNPDFLQALQVFDTLLQQDSLSEYWGLAPGSMGWGQLREPLMKATSGVNLIDRPKYLKLFEKQLNRSWGDFQSRWQQINPSPAFAQVLAALPVEYRQLFAQEAPPVAEGLNRLYALVRFLDGLWLEMHTFLAVQAVVGQLALTADLGMGLELTRPNWNTYFEIDIAALVGYQLLGISCTCLDQKSACKNKGFEIIHRVRQLGGDEVREVLKMMLVTCASAKDQARLQQELAVETGSGKANILVCGKADLPQVLFQQKIRDFLAYPLTV